MQPSPALRELKTISGHSSFCSMADGYPEGHELKHAFAWMPSALCRLYTVKSDIRNFVTSGWYNLYTRQPLPLQSMQVWNLKDQGHDLK